MGIMLTPHCCSIFRNLARQVVRFPNARYHDSPIETGEDEGEQTNCEKSDESRVRHV